MSTYIDPESDHGYKYTADGYAVVLIEQTSRGYLVAKVYETDEGDYIDESKAILVPSVFDSPPTEKLADSVARLGAKLEELRKEAEGIKIAKRELEQEAAELKKRTDSHAALQRIFDFIDGKITHYVLESQYGGGIQIVTQDSTKTEFARTGKERKLLTLFGCEDGNLAYKLNQYSDGSGCWTMCYPACSEDEARAIAEGLLAVRFTETPRRDVIDAARRLNIAVPDEYAAAVNAAQLKAAQQHLDGKRREMEVAQAQVAALTNPATA